MGERESYSIRQMVDLTGLSEFTIRGWENRYSAFSPERSETQRREYSKSDIERAILLRELLKRGHKIGKIANLNGPELKSLFEIEEGLNATVAQKKKPDAVATALELVSLQKWDELDRFIKSLKIENAEQLIHGFSLPAIEAVSTDIEAGRISISQEHVFFSFLKEKIYAVLGALEQKRVKPAPSKVRFVLATPEGDFHEIGLLLAHLQIRSRGFASLYLGPSTPARDLSETALRFHASHILVVATVAKENGAKKSGAKQNFLSYIHDLQTNVGSRPKIWVAGSQISISHVPNPSLSAVGSFEVFEELLENLGGSRE